MHKKYIFQIIVLFFFSVGCSNSGNTKKELESSTVEEPRSTQELDPLKLHNLAMNNNLRELQTLLVQGVDVNTLDADSRTALMYASFEGYTDIIETLISYGANMDHCDLNGRTALMFAASGSFPYAVKLLLDNGAATNVQDSEENFTALMYAAAEGQLENVKLLLIYGADPNVTDIDGDTAQVFAINNGHQGVADYLISYRKN